MQFKKEEEEEEKEKQNGLKEKWGGGVGELDVSESEQVVLLGLKTKIIARNSSVR